MERCCELCKENPAQECPDYILCRNEGPICHESDACRKKRQQIKSKLLGEIGITIKIALASNANRIQAQKILNILENLQEEEAVEDLIITTTGTLGLEGIGITLSIVRKGAMVIYGNIDENKIERIWKEDILNGQIVSEWVLFQTGTSTLIPNVSSHSEHPFYQSQIFLSGRHCSIIDPINIEEYVALGGYYALNIALRELDQSTLLDLINSSSLRDRYNKGDYFYKKLMALQSSNVKPKYILCTGNEPSPLCRKNQYLLNGEPFKLIEALTILAYITDISNAYIAINYDYEIAYERLVLAIEKAKNYHLLGNNILGTGFDFDIQLKRIPYQNFITDETALVGFLNGECTPRLTPPELTSIGLYNKPTLLLAVETAFNVPSLILEGEDWLTAIGTAKSPGTNCLSLRGTKYNGVVEIPFGTPLKEILYDIGNVHLLEKEIKAVQIGDCIGGILPSRLFSTGWDYERLSKFGVSISEPLLIPIDEETSIPEWLYVQMQNITKESCGVCTACREGSQRITEILERLLNHKAKSDDLILLKELAEYMRDVSLCHFGKSASVYVLNSLMYFKNEFDALI